MTGLAKVLRKAVSVPLLSIWWAAMQPYELAEVETAFESYISDPKECRFAPKPGDIVKRIEAAQGNDHRPGADEAWGMLIRLVSDEWETGGVERRDA